MMNVPGTEEEIYLDIAFAAPHNGIYGSWIILNSYHLLSEIILHLKDAFIPDFLDERKIIFSVSIWTYEVLLYSF